MRNEPYPMYLAGEAVQPNADLEVTNPYTGEVAARTAYADAEHLDRAIAAAADARGPMARTKPYERQAILLALVERVEARHEELARTLCVEAGKPIVYARGEVTRLVDTLRIAAEESVRLAGSQLTLEISERASGYRGAWKRVPVGPCAFITPWNFPLNLVAHKIAPALAAGCPFVLKPASSTPIGALVLGEMLAELDLPRGAFSILPMSSSDAGALVEDDRLKKLSFTGSPEVGWALKAKAGKKKVTLELGGNAACIVDAGADLEDVVQRLIFGAFYQSGQSCISVQRILAHAAIYDELRERLVAAASDLVMGDPSEEETFIGPIISEDEAKRIESWVQEAVDRGARVLCGGERSGNLYPATVVEDVPRDLPLSCEEVFGPVAVLSRVPDFDAALAEANDSAYGLQAGVFTRDLFRAMRVWDELEVGGVLINEVPSFRVDNMPYGGVKDSGFGREGVRWAIEEMSEPRLLVIREG